MMYICIIIRCSCETRLSEHVRDFSTIYVDTPISWYRAFVHTTIQSLYYLIREEITIEKLYH